MTYTIRSILSRLHVTSVKSDVAEIHISSQVPPLVSVILQLYVFGQTRDRSHWRKELAAIMTVLTRNRKASGELLRLKDMQECLREVSPQATLNEAYRGLLQDPDYAGLVPRRTRPPRERDVANLVAALINDLRSPDQAQPTSWELADSVIGSIDSWA